MKRLILSVSLVLFFFCSNAQKIKTSEYDKFNKAYRIETSSVALKAGLSYGLSFSLRSIGPTIFVKLDGYNYIKTGITEGTQAIFLLSNDSTVTIRSKGLQTTSRFDFGQKFSFEYYVTEEDLAMLRTNTIVGIRLYGAENYTDVEIKEKDSKDINKTADIFLKEFISKLPEMIKS